MLGALMAALVLFVPIASAAGAEQPVGASGIFKLKGSNGYSILVLAGSRRADGQGEISFLVSRKRSAAIYTASATVTQAGIQADLGALGKVSVALVLSGQKTTERPRCGGKPVTYETASYQGTIEFHGEGGYTEASATSAPLLTKLLLSLACSAPGSTELIASGLPGASLSVGSLSKRPGLSLKVKKNRPDAHTSIEVEISEENDGIKIARGTSMSTGSSAFDYDPLLRTATVEPPAPFSGRGVFHRKAPASKRWTGNLAVDLPGREDVPLTGRLPVKLVPSRSTHSVHHASPRLARILSGE
jgi:hypothetical protein